MQPKAFMRSLVAVSIVASLAACGDKADDIAEIVEQQKQQNEQQQQQQNYTNSGGTDPMPPTIDGPSTTELLTISVPGGKDADGNYLAYPWNAEGDTKFWYGLDEYEVVVPEASDSVIHLTFAAEYAVDGEAGPGAELIDVLDGKSGEITIVLPEGTHHMSSSLRVDMSLYPDITSITLMGHGIDKTILSYTETTETVSDSVHFSSATNLEMAHFTVVDSGKNALLVDESNGVYMHHVGAIWPGEPEKANGAYGLYPVESQNVIVEDSFAFGSADAGIYVGQTDNIVVRRNFAVQNVAGIEIENSDNADVYDNYAYMNTGGVLVFDLPIGNGRYGLGTRVFRNVSVSNNEENFAAPGVVAAVPPGTGILLLASDTVEIFDNDISGNETFGVAAVSYFMMDQNVLNYTGHPDLGPGSLSTIIADGWKPTLRAINIHSNRFTNTGSNPRGNLIEAPLTDGAPGIIEAFSGLNGYLPAIITDGMGQNLANNGVIEFAITAGGAIPFEAPYAEDGSDELCIDPAQNVSTGTVLEHTGAISAIAGAGLNLAAATFEIDNDGSYLFNCEDNPLDRLPAYTATFRGTVFGCGADDNGEICTSSMPPEGN